MKHLSWQDVDEQMNVRLQDDFGEDTPPFSVSIASLCKGGVQVLAAAPASAEGDGASSAAAASGSASLFSLAQDAFDMQMVQQAQDVMEACDGRVLPSVFEQEAAADGRQSAAPSVAATEAQEAEAEAEAVAMASEPGDAANPKPLGDAPAPILASAVQRNKRSSATEATRHSSREVKRTRRSFPPQATRAPSARASLDIDNEQALDVTGISVGQQLMALGLAPAGGRVWYRATVIALRERFPPIVVKVPRKCLNPFHHDLTHTHIHREPLLHAAPRQFKATEDGDTLPLLLPSTITAYVHKSDTKPIDA